MRTTGLTAPRPIGDPVTRGRDLALRVAAELPRLRRHARTLAGSRGGGDRCTAAALAAILADRSLLAGGLSPRVALFRALHHAVATDAGAPASCAQRPRAAWLLCRTEAFRADEIAAILDITPAEAEALLAAAPCGDGAGRAIATPRDGTDGHPGH